LRKFHPAHELAAYTAVERQNLEQVRRDMAHPPRIQVIAALVASLVAQGCASPGLATQQTLRVETPGCAPVACELSNDRGRWTVPSTPGSVLVTTSNATLNVSCRAGDGAEFSFGAPSSQSQETGTGALVGGVVGGVGIGTAIGATALMFIPVLGVLVVLTGAAVGVAAGATAESAQRTIRYPELLTIPMACMSAGSVSSTGPGVGTGLGLGVQGLPLAQAREAGLGERGGVLVTSVLDGSPAAKAGLRSGDIILSAAGRPLRDTGDMEAHTIVLAPGGSLTLSVWRDGQTLELVLARPRPTP
jgi:hypothetical protein